MQALMLNYKCNLPGLTSKEHHIAHAPPASHDISESKYVVSSLIPASSHLFNLARRKNIENAGTYGWEEPGDEASFPAPRNPHTKRY